MPEVQKMFNIKIAPVKFLKACSIKELKEVQLLLEMPEFKEKLKYYRPKRNTTTKKILKK